MHKFLYFFLLTSTFAQTVSDYAYTGAEASAMAGAVVAEKGNNWSIFHNPAGIAEIDEIRFSAGGGKIYGYNWLPAYHLSVIVPTSVFGHIGFGLKKFETKYEGITLSREQTLSIAHGFNLQKDKNSHLAMGYTTNFVQWDLGKSAGLSGNGSDGLELGSAYTGTVDIGILASLREKYRFGVFITNVNSGAIGKGITRQILPRRINMGITYKPISTLATSITAERLLSRDDLQVKGAIRYRLNSYLEICTGAQSKPNKFGIGTIFTLNSQSVSYGLLTHPVMPMTHQFNLSISFD